jgi:pimeloyl-ACP methyl ester carboxylesterase
MAKYDLPATMDYIERTTEQDQLVYIGHSQGTLISFAALSTNPEFATKIKLFIALAPIVTIGNIMVPYLKTVAEITTVFGVSMVVIMAVVMVTKVMVVMVMMMVMMMKMIIMVIIINTCPAVSFHFQAVAPVIDAPFFPGDIWRIQFIDKSFCNGLTEQKLCYQVATFFFGNDPTNVNYVSKY